MFCFVPSYCSIRIYKFKGVIAACRAAAADLRLAEGIFDVLENMPGSRAKTHSGFRQLPWTYLFSNL